MDIAVVVIYMLAVIIVGLSRGYRTKNLRDFAVGDKSFSIAVLLATISATYTGGGSTLGISERVFKSGIILVLVGILCNVIYKSIITFIIVPRFANLQQYISMGEVMGGFYKKPAQILTGIFGSIRCLGNVASQTMAMGLILQYFMGASFEWAVIIGAGIVVLYTSFGGIRAVAATDFIQFAVLILGIVIIANFALVQVGGYGMLWAKLPNSHKIIFADREIFIEHVILLFILASPFLDPAQVQRLLLSNDNQKTKISMALATLIDPIIFFLIGCIGLCAVVLFPDIDSNLAMLTVVEKSLPNDLLRGIAIAGLLAVVMSTADSYLNSATLAVVNDVILPLKNTIASKRFELITIRLSTVILGAVSIVVALYFKNIINIVLAFISFWGTYMAVPFFAGLFGLKASSKSFWASTLLGIPTFIIWSYFFKSTGLHPLFPGLTISAIGFFTIYALEKKT